MCDPFHFPWQVNQEFCLLLIFSLPSSTILVQGSLIFSLFHCTKLPKCSLSSLAIPIHSAYQLTNLLQNTCSNFFISFIMKFQILGFYPNCATPHHPPFLHSNLPCQAAWSHLLLFLAWFPRLRIPLLPLYLSTTLSYCIVIFHVMCLFPSTLSQGSVHSSDFPSSAKRTAHCRHTIMSWLN